MDKLEEVAEIEETFFDDHPDDSDDDTDVAENKPNE